MFTIKNFLDSIDPTHKLFYLVVSAIVGGVIYLWRRFSPSTWDAVTKKNPTLQQLPALLFAALLSAAPAIGKPLAQVITQTIMGAVLGALPAIGGHYVMKELPWVPYNGGHPIQTPEPSPRVPPDLPKAA